MLGATALSRSRPRARPGAADAAECIVLGETALSRRRPARQLCAGTGGSGSSRAAAAASFSARTAVQISSR
ncbi:MAG: hypothetical protein QOF29_2374 [bacterium]